MDNRPCDACGGEHGALVAGLRRQFWQMVPVRSIAWGEDAAALACPHVQGEVLRAIVRHEHTVRFSPSARYIVLFLRAYFGRIERARDYCPDDGLLEHYVALLTSTDMSSAAAAAAAAAGGGASYKTYALDRDQRTRIVLREEEAMISQGTTGLQTWDAGIRLADYVFEHPEIVRGKNVVELGAGCGLSGAARVISTDVNGAVLEVLEHNRQINPAISDVVEITEFDWSDDDKCRSLARSADVVIGADVAYDPRALPALVSALQALLVAPEQTAYIAMAFRQPTTFDLLMQLIDDTRVLQRSVADLAGVPMATLCKHSPSGEIRLVLVTRSPMAQKGSGAEANRDHRA